MIFNDALNIFYLRLYGIRHMVRYPSDGERRNPCTNIWTTLFDYAPSHRQDSTYYGLCYTSPVALAGTRNISLVHHERYIRRPISP